MDQAQLLDVLRKQGVNDPRVLDALARVPRSEFVSASDRAYAYENRPLDIGWQQTISQPYIVGLMTQLARIAPGERVLEIGTGSGYQTAIVGLLAGEVFTIEIVEALARRAQDTLRRLGLAENVHFLEGDGASGWPPAAPYAAILVTAAPREVPRALTAQLGVGGRLVIPVGVHEQQLLLIERSPTGLTERTIAPVRFVPLTGAATAIQ